MRSGGGSFLIWSGAIRRLQLVELADHPRCPRSLRESFQHLLQAGECRLGLYDGAGPLLVEALKETGARRVLDLCSGCGGPWPRLARVLSDAGLDLQVALSDRFPSREIAIPDAHRVSFRALPEPLDARGSGSLPGLRTLFSSFHHFPPEQARQVIASARSAGEGVAVFEITERRARALAVNAFVLPLAMLFAAPFLLARRWTTLAWTYTGVLPLLLAWDGVVSCLRSYGPDELLELAHDAAPGYRWRAGRLPIPRSPTRLTFLVGTPPRPVVDATTRIR